MKKLLSLLLVGVMSVMLLAGCGTTGGGQDNPDSGSDETEKSISIAQSANFSMGFAPGVQSYNSDFVLYARARGVSEWKIANMVSRFALPPLITMLAQSFGFMIAGSSMVESVFSIPGLGSMLVTALNARDTITINACVLLTAVIFVLVNFLADCLNTLLNPQSQMGGRS